MSTEAQGKFPQSLAISHSNRANRPLRNPVPVLRRTGHDHRQQGDEHDGLDCRRRTLHVHWILFLLLDPLLPRRLQSLQTHMQQLPKSHRQERRLSELS